MRGTLRIYLGCAPGVGKTYAMLNEGWRRRERGADVVVGLVVTHDRPSTSAQLRDLEVVPPRSVFYRGRPWEELDVDAILARRPAVVLVDELAHTNVPGTANEKRWQDIEALLAAGIEVIATVNIQHLESVNDVVNRITGVVQHETVPDAVVRRADQIELVDMSPEALRRRMAHGNVYKPEKVDAALANYFRLGNLGALREIALLWVADRVEDSLQRYRVQHGITNTWETRERVLVALTGAPGGEDLIRRAARMARRTKGDLVGAHVVRSAGLTHPEPVLLARQQRLLEELGGSWHDIVGEDVPSTIVAFATAQHATQIVLGTSRRSRVTELLHGSVINRILRDARDIDVHVIATDAEVSAMSRRSRVPIASAQPRRRIAIAFVVAAIAIAVLAMLSSQNSAIDPRAKGGVTASAGLLIFLGVVLVVAAIGGRVPALVTAFVSLAVVDWYLMPPYRSFAIAHSADAVYIVAFIATAVAVSAVVDAAARHRVAALQSQQEADTVLALADRLTRQNPPQVVVEEIHETLRRTSVALLMPNGDRWAVEASIGDGAITAPTDGEHYALRDGHVLVMTGPPLRAEQHRLVAGLLSYLEAIVAMRKLQLEAGVAESLSHANDLRNALLAAVSHDLRTPLASIKALTSGWLEPDVTWSVANTHEFMVSIDEEADRLHNLVENLLDMSRLQSGALQLTRRPTGLDEIVPAALASLGDRSHGVVVDVDESLPRVDVDPALLERAVANVLDNAVRHAGQVEREKAVRVEAAAVAGRIDLRVVDKGSGIPVAQRDRVFEPFQRLGDTPSNTGVGLGLAVAKGFVDAVGGELTLEDTPGGGVTMVMALPIATSPLTQECAS
jgi:two-component system, OmpR family, sensor histidine kinase KdpD